VKQKKAKQQQKTKAEMVCLGGLAYNKTTTTKQQTTTTTTKVKTNFLFPRFVHLMQTVELYSTRTSFESRKNLIALTSFILTRRELSISCQLPLKLKYILT